MQREITEKSLLLNKDGSLATKGYATTMNFQYNGEWAKKFPFKLKEWNFYQFVKDGYSVQLTIGHVSYACSVSANVIDTNTGKRWDMGVMTFFAKPKLDDNPQEPSVVTYANKQFQMSFTVTENARILHFCGNNKQFAHMEIQIVAQNDVSNPKLVIATPFAKKHQFYLNYKENYYFATGFVQIDDFHLDLDGAVGLIDWGRGIWPYRHEWFWGNLTAMVNGVPFGFNIGWGFGDLSNATENIYFVDKISYKVGHLHVERNTNDYMSPWHIFDDQGKMDLHFTPTFDNYTQNKAVIVDTHCHQLYGKYSGYVLTNNGKFEFENLFAFIEHAQNRG